MVEVAEAGAGVSQQQQGARVQVIKACLVNHWGCQGEVVPCGVEFDSVQVVQAQAHVRPPGDAGLALLCAAFLEPMGQLFAPCIAGACDGEQVMGRHRQRAILLGHGRCKKRMRLGVQVQISVGAKKPQARTACAVTGLGL